MSSIDTCVLVCEKEVYHVNTLKFKYFSSVYVKIFVYIVYDKKGWWLAVAVMKGVKKVSSLCSIIPFITLSKQKSAYKHLAFPF